jgi:hypothetical protein
VERQLVLRGAGAGAVAGLIAFVFARIFAEPAIQQAIDYESGRDAAKDAIAQAAGHVVDSSDMELFSRTVQRNAGLGLGVVLFGVAMGGLFAVAYVITARHTPSLGPRARAALVALAAFTGLFLVPFLKYPANPPSIGNPDTIKQRTLLYLTMLVVSLAGLLIAVIIGHRLAPRLGTWNATLAAGAGYLVLIAIAVTVLPDLGHLHANGGRFATETPQPLADASGKIVYPGFPADTLFRFRLTSLGTQVVLWTALALVFAPLAERVQAGGRTRDAAFADAS